MTKATRNRIFFLLSAGLVLVLAAVHLQIVKEGVSNVSPPLQASVRHADSALQQAIDAKTEALQFMVWPTERRPLKAEYLALLQSKVTLDPVSLESWLAMLELLLDVEDIQREATEINWVLQRTLVMAQWQWKWQRVLVKACVLQQDILTPEVQQDCAKLLQNYSWRSLKAEARALRVTPETLAEVLRSSNVELKDEG